MKLQPSSFQRRVGFEEKGIKDEVKLIWGIHLFLVIVQSNPGANDSGKVIPFMLLLLLTGNLLMSQVSDLEKSHNHIDY